MDLPAAISASSIILMPKMRTLSNVKIVMVVTAAVTARTFVLGFAKFASEQGHAVTVISDAAEAIERGHSGSSISFVSVSMDREPHPRKDLTSLVNMIRVISREKPDLLVYATPKASLLASIAGTLLRVPVRVYQLWGLRLETATGWPRKILAVMERITAGLSTSIVANSDSLAKLYCKLGLNGRTPLVTLGHGSSHGVDLERFSRDAEIPSLDKDLAVSIARQKGVVVGYVGRLHPDKGIDTLIDAAEVCADRGISINLLLVGGDEGADIERRIDGLPNSVHTYLAGSVNDPRPHFAAMDVLVLVSRREGFPNVVLEAASMEIPAIVSDATGVIDAVVPGHTGVIVPVGDAEALADAIQEMAENPEERRRLGREARKHVAENFPQEQVWKRLEDYLIDGIDL